MTPTRSTHGARIAATAAAAIVPVATLTGTVVTLVSVTVVALPGRGP